MRGSVCRVGWRTNYRLRHINNYSRMNIMFYNGEMHERKTKIQLTRHILKFSVREAAYRMRAKK